MTFSSNVILNEMSSAKCHLLFGIFLIAQHEERPLYYVHMVASRYQSSTNRHYLMTDKVILFMSDGKPTDAEDEILNEISEQNAKLNNEVIIHTFGIGLTDDGKYIYIKVHFTQS